jgi:hypothetical protein
MENLINQPFWNAMSPQNKSAMMSKMAGMYDMQAAAGRVSLQSRMQDDLAALEAGKPVSPISAHEWAAVMPLQASPAERIQLEKTYQQYQQTMQLQPVYQTIVNGTAQQGIAAVQSMAPQEGDPDFKFKQALYATAQAKLNAVQTAREKDPGTWLQLNSLWLKMPLSSTRTIRHPVNIWCRAFSLRKTASASTARRSSLSRWLITCCARSTTARKPAS